MKDASVKKTRAATVSVVYNVCITIAKVVVAVFSGSVSVLSEALHSLGDILASVFAWLSVRISDKPADSEHPFGHGKIETFAGLAEALLLAGAAVYVAVEAISRLASPEGIVVDVAFWAIMATAAVNVFVGRYLMKVAGETDSDALRADAAHIIADFITSLGVLFALGLVWLTDNPVFDPLVALGLSAWILFTATRIGIKSFNLLVDVSLPEEEVKLIKSILREHPKVRGHHQLRTRKSGSQRHIDGHILLDDNLSLIEAHDITEDVENRIRAALPNTSISLHMEPFTQELQHRAVKHADEPGPVID